MSEVELLYEKAGVEKCNSNLKDIMPDICLKHNEDENYKCEDCEYNWYPEFTAEKQIELIKWLGKNKNGFGLFDDGTEGLSCHCDFHWEWFRKDCYAEDFDNALVGLINSLWQDLTEEEKQQIREILK